MEKWVRKITESWIPVEDEMRRKGKEEGKKRGGKEDEMKMK